MYKKYGFITKSDIKNLFNNDGGDIASQFDYGGCLDEDLVLLV